MGAAQDPTADEDAHPDPGADGDEGHIGDAAGPPAPLLAERRQVDVVLNDDRDGDLLLQQRSDRRAGEPRGVDDMADLAAAADRSRQTDGDGRGSVRTQLRGQLPHPHREPLGGQAVDRFGPLGEHMAATVRGGRSQ